MAVRKPNKFEWFIIFIAVVFMLALARPLLFDPAYKKFVERSQQDKLEKGDVVLLVQGDKHGGYMDYRLSAVWRNRHGTRIPWNVGDRIPDLREVANEALTTLPKRVVFYQAYGNRLDKLGSFFVLNDGVSIKLDIGQRGLIGRWLNRPVSLNSFETFVRQDMLAQP